LARLEEDITHAAGLLFPINLNSPKQVQELLFKQLKLPPVAKNASGEESTKHAVLVELAPLHPVPKMLLEHRELSKLLNTYVDVLPTMINKHTGRIHTNFNQTGVATGRLSSNDPNLQNIPVGDATDHMTVRSAFKAGAGNLFVAADYSQIELRILAYLSQDQALIAAFKEDRDIHRETAMYLFEKEQNEISHEERQIGKRINFSVLYGITPFGLSKDLKIPLAAAKKYIDRYFGRYKGVAAWMESIIERAKKDGYVTTHWGRRRYVPAIRERNKVLYQEACRVAINTVAQGTAAEVMKRAMIALADIFKKQNLSAQMLLQIHDEIVVEVRADQVDTVEELTKNTLESIVDWNVPLIVTTRRGADWQAVSK
jgi:DNA polymerase-1